MSIDCGTAIRLAGSLMTRRTRPSIQLLVVGSAHEERNSANVLFVIKDDVEDKQVNERE